MSEFSEQELSEDFAIAVPADRLAELEAYLAEMRQLQQQRQQGRQSHEQLPRIRPAQPGQLLGEGST